VVGALAELAFGLHVDLPGAPEAIEVVDEVSAHEGLERLVDALDVDSLLQHFVAVDLREELRNIGDERRRERADLGPFARLGDESLRVLRQELDVRTRAIFQHERDAAGSTDARDCGRWERERDRLANLPELPIDVRLDRAVLLLARRALVPV